MMDKNTLKRAFSTVRREWHNPHFWARYTNTHINGKFYNDKRTHTDPRIIEEDWDNLIILDACRFDTFKNILPKFDIDGDLSSRISEGSSSQEFISRNFQGKNFDDVVYLTANPFIKTMLSDSTFYKTEHLWLTNWDDKNETVHPESVMSELIDTVDKYNNKRVVAHFMQPHYPFIGDYRLSNQSGYSEVRSSASDKSHDNMEPVWAKLRKRKTDLDKVKEAYECNLELVLDVIAESLQDLSGKTVITSDHGNSFGERLKPVPFKVYGHPSNVHLESLVKVPWFTVRNDSRRDTTSSEDLNSNSIETEQSTVDDRLESLGYK